MAHDGRRRAVEDKMLALGDEIDGTGGTAHAACVLIQDQLRGRATVGGRDAFGALEQAVARNTDSSAMTSAGPRGDETGAQAVETREIELDRINLHSGSICDKLS